MGTYVGPAVVMLPSGTTFAVSARLESAFAPGMEAWRGVVSADDRQALWDTLKVVWARLRLPDGSEGVFSSAGLEGMAGQDLRMNGHGPAPF